MAPLFVCRNWSIMWCRVAWIYIREAQEMCHRFYSGRRSMDQKWKDMCTYICTHTNTNSASGTDRPSGSSGPVGVWRATSLSDKHTDCRGPGLGCGSRPLLQILSVSLCRPPWLTEAGQQSRFLCVFLRWRRQRLPTRISTAAPRGSWLSFHYCEQNRFSFCGVVRMAAVCFGSACVYMTGEQTVIKWVKLK